MQSFIMDGLVGIISCLLLGPFPVQPPWFPGCVGAWLRV
jgi:hypothetical protein